MPPLSRFDEAAHDSVCSQARVGHATYRFTDRRDGNFSSTHNSEAGVANARRELAVSLQTGVDMIAWLDQVHSSTVVVDPPVGERHQGDAVVLTTPGRVAAVVVADCVPVLMATTTKAPNTVVAAVHSGRAGTVSGVVTETLNVFTTLGVEPSQVAAVIGPAIGGCCYEVEATLRGHVADVVPAAFAETTWGTPSLDLIAGVDEQLRTAGVTNVSRDGGCTRCDDRWFSHRASTGALQRPPGRQVGAVRCGL